MLTLITITGDRQWAFSRLEEYITAQTVGPTRWIVVDDGVEPTVTTCGQEVSRRSPGQQPAESFRNNLLLAFSHCGVGRRDKVLFIEDDDWYSPYHIESVSTLLDSCSLAGQAHAKFYHVGERKWKVHPNASHASLAQTGFRGDDMKRLIMEYLGGTRVPQQLDGHIWRRANVPDTLKRLLPASTTTVGIKGVPGRSGLGIGHANLDNEHKDDPEMKMLKLWIGSAADQYAFCYKDYNGNN